MPDDEPSTVAFFALAKMHGPMAKEAEIGAAL